MTTLENPTVPFTISTPVVSGGTLKANGSWHNEGKHVGSHACAVDFSVDQTNWNEDEGAPILAIADGTVYYIYML
jgi:hypothetical protein